MGHPGRQQYRAAEQDQAVLHQRRDQQQTAEPSFPAFPGVRQQREDQESDEKGIDAILPHLLRMTYGLDGQRSHQGRQERGDTTDAGPGQQEEQDRHGHDARRRGQQANAEGRAVYLLDHP